jgi:hypothetical protein
LYYTRDSKAGDPITALYCSSTPVNNKKTELGYHKTAKNGDYGEDCDLNKGALGDYIYLVMVSQPHPSSILTSSLIGSGSWTVVCIAGAFMMVSVIAAMVYCKKKKNINKIKKSKKEPTE